MNTPTDWDAVSFIIDYEAGNLDQLDVIEGFQKLVDEGTIYHLQGSYRRAAQALYNAGLINK